MSADSGVGGPTTESGSGSASVSSDRLAVRIARRGREAGRARAGAALEATRRALARPTASDLLVIALTLSVALAAGAALVGSTLAALAVGAGIAAAVACLPLSSSRPAVRAVGGALAVPVSLATVAPSAYALAVWLGGGGYGRFAAVALWALVLAGFAAALAPAHWERLGDGGVRRAGYGAVLAALGVAAVAIVRATPEAGVRSRADAAVADLGSLAYEVTIAAEGTWAVLTFCTLLAAVAACCSRALGTVPLERFLPPDRREGFATAATAVRRRLRILVGVGALGVVLAVAGPLAADGPSPSLASPDWVRTALPAPLGEAVATLATASPLRALLVSLGFVAAAALVGTRFRRAIRRGPGSALATALAPAAGGALVAVGLAVALADPAADAAVASTLEGAVPGAIADLLAAAPSFVLAAIGLVLALWALASTLFAVTWLRALRLLPPRAIAPALAAGSTLVLAIALAVVGRLEFAILVAAAAFVVQDAGEYADTLRVELGDGAATLRAELVHAGSSLLAGALVVVGTAALSRWLAGTTLVHGRPIAAVAVAVGTLALALVAWALRG